ncbi:MAG: 5-formyltetrahydrofolate cyclo-ligase [Rhizobacter sp.]|nr:5-formyltetrahydrofolate cyclo-ligase [Rhizobacter sp.]
MSVASPTSRQALRAQLLATRERFVLSPEGSSAQPLIARELAQIIDRLEPECLGVYWPMRSEFNAAALWHDDMVGTSLSLSFELALPFARREARQMHYRLWDGAAPTLKDECGIATSDGPPVMPDVVLVPCVGFTRSGYRMGYGGGYFDRWLAANPQVTAVGVAWAVGEVSEAEFAAEPHDQPLAVIVTERGVVA